MKQDRTLQDVIDKIRKDGDSQFGPSMIDVEELIEAYFYMRKMWLESMAINESFKSEVLDI